VTTAATLPTATHDATPKPAVAPTTTAPAPVADRHGRPGADYFCRHCGATAEGPEPPAGWWRLQRRQPGYTGRVFTTSGLYCSVGCVAADTAATADRAANPG